MAEKDCLDIDRVAFIGRTYSEYMRIFDLDASVFRNGAILDCPAGPSSFTAEARRAGFSVTACDSVYNLPVEHLAAKGKKDIEHVFEKLDEVRHLYAWDYYKGKDEIVSLRQASLAAFLRDFPDGMAEGRYVHGVLPRLPFPDNAFSLVLVSHFLFLYGDRLDLNFHKACVKEIMRVSSGEARIFPLQGLDAKPYPYIGELLSFLEAENIAAKIVDVPFEFQKGSNKILRLNNGSN